MAGSVWEQVTLPISFTTLVFTGSVSSTTRAGLCAIDSYTNNVTALRLTSAAGSGDPLWWVAFGK